MKIERKINKYPLAKDALIGHFISSIEYLRATGVPHAALTGKGIGVLKPDLELRVGCSVS